MALIKKLKTERINCDDSDNQVNSAVIRDTFDRFEDIVIENTLIYLSFDDKLKFQFVSKQWMRTVFHRQNELDLKPIFFKLFEHYYRDIKGNEDNIINAIECLLKTCSEVKKIDVDFNCLLHSETLKISFLGKLILLFADNCKHLQSFYLYSKISNAFDTKLWEYFGEKCGKNIQNADISILTLNNCRVFLRQCPNLISLKKIRLTNLIDENSGETLSPKLSEVKDLIIYKNFDLMSLFVIKYASTLKCLGIDLFKTKSSNNLLSHVSKLTNLETLNLTLDDKTPVDDNLEQIGINCKKLISLRLCLKYDRNYTVCEQIMYSLKCFKLLEKLEVITGNISPFRLCGYPSFWGNELLLPNLFDKCIHLTHLFVDSYLDRYFFYCIHKYVPQIKVLRINTYFEDFNDESLRFISKLSELKVLEINLSETRYGSLMFTDDGVRHLIDSCSQLQSLTFKPIPFITMKIIDKLISVAKQKSYISFYHHFETLFDDMTKRDTIQHIIDTLRHTILPKNLKLIVNE